MTNHFRLEKDEETRKEWRIYTKVTPERKKGFQKTFQLQLLNKILQHIFLLYLCILRLKKRKKETERNQLR